MNEIKCNIPFVIEKDATGERCYDIYSRMLNDRIIFINGAIDNFTAGAVCAQLLYLDSNNSEEEISLYINSGGGVIDAGLAIIDTMELIQAPIKTVCVGGCYSMAAVILACGTKGRRCGLPRSRVMIHQPSGGVEGITTEIQNYTEEILRMKKLLNEVLCDKTGQKMDIIERDTERDFYMSPEQAKKYGLIDRVIKKRNK